MRKRFYFRTIKQGCFAEKFKMENYRNQSEIQSDNPTEKCMFRLKNRIA